MLLVALLIAAAPPVAGAAMPEDAAHRADRLRTQQLNSQLHNNAESLVVAPGDAQAYQRARDEYQQRLAAWRRRVAACEAGDYSACE